MTRVKGGIQTRKSHKKLLNLAKGYRMTRSKQVKKAQEAVLHAGQYAYNGRKLRKRDMRSTWVVRLNASLREVGQTYGTFIHALKVKNIALDRKVLSFISQEHPEAFNALVKEVSAK